MPLELAALFVVYIAVYTGYRIIVGKIRHKPWSEVLADGAKPTTRSIWLDGALFAGLILAVCGLVFAGAYWIIHH